MITGGNYSHSLWVILDAHALFVTKVIIDERVSLELPHSEALCI
jgi:hypothetical protein